MIDILETIKADLLWEWDHNDDITRDDIVFILDQYIKEQDMKEFKEQVKNTLFLTKTQ